MGKNKNKNIVPEAIQLPVAKNNSYMIVVHPEFAEDFVSLEGSQKKEIVRRLDRISETGSFGSNDTERRNLAKGLIEVKFKSGIRVYGGIRKINGKDVFYATVLGEKGDEAKQNRDIKKATDLYVSAVNKDTQRAPLLSNEITFNEIFEINKKQYKQYMLNKSLRSA